MPATSAEELRFERPGKNFFRILVVDDEEVPRRVLKGMLEAAGYTGVEEADSGERALELLRGQEYHLLLLDKNMPGVDGMEVLRQGRQLWPDCEFIMVTAYGSMEAACEAMDLGAASFMTKPFPEMQAVLNRVDECLERVVTRLENRYLIDMLHELVAEIETSREKLARLQQSSGEPSTALAGAAEVQQAITRLKDLARALQELFRSSQVVTQDVIHLVGREIESSVALLEKKEPC